MKMGPAQYTTCSGADEHCSILSRAKFALGPAVLAVAQLREDHTHSRTMRQQSSAESRLSAEESAEARSIGKLSGAGRHEEPFPRSLGCSEPLQLVVYCSCSPGRATNMPLASRFPMSHDRPRDALRRICSLRGQGRKTHGKGLQCLAYVPPNDGSIEHVRRLLLRSVEWPRRNARR